MARHNESILDILIQLPWWVSVLIAAIAYITLTFIIPSIQTENLLFRSLGKIGLRRERVPYQATCLSGGSVPRFMIST